MPHFGDAPIRQISEWERNQPGQREPHGVVPLHAQQQANGARRANMHLVVSNDVEGVHGLYSCRESGDEGLPLFGLNPFDVQLGLCRGALSEKTSQPVTHDAMGVNQQRGFRHAFTRCVALQGR